jgi:hypothetical protein
VRVEYMLAVTGTMRAYLLVQYHEDKRRNVRPRIVRSGVIMKQQAADLTRRSDDEGLGNLIETHTLNSIRHGDTCGVLHELPWKASVILLER